MCTRKKKKNSAKTNYSYEKHCREQNLQQKQCHFGNSTILILLPYSDSKKLQKSYNTISTKYQLHTSMKKKFSENYLDTRNVSCMFLLS